MDKREIINKAIEEDLMIEIHYTKTDNTSSTRILSEIEYSQEYGCDYIHAFCQKRQEYRTFKIERISQIKIVSGTQKQTDKKDNRTYEFNPNKRIFNLYGFFTTS